MLTTDSCTLYLKSGNGFTRYFIPLCHWEEREANNVLKSGMANADSVVVYAFKSDIPKALQELLRTHKVNQDMLVYGECGYEFDNTTPQSVSACMKEFREEYDSHTVKSLDKLLYGSESLQHFKFSAR